MGIKVIMICDYCHKEQITNADGLDMYTIQELINGPVMCAACAEDFVYERENSDKDNLQEVR